MKTARKILFVGLFAAFLCLVVPAVLGQVSNSTSTSSPPPVYLSQTTINYLAEATPEGLIIGFVSALAGYFSSNPPEDFSLPKFLYTALISAVIGFLSLYMGWDYTAITTWLANGFVTWYLWKASNIIANYITSHLSQTTTASSATGPPATTST